MSKGRSVADCWVTAYCSGVSRAMASWSFVYCVMGMSSPISGQHAGGRKRSDIGRTSSRFSADAQVGAHRSPRGPARTSRSKPIPAGGSAARRSGRVLNSLVLSGSCRARGWLPS
ncbi:hypothetical protein ACFPRL_13800 [Pseudoclavibacter helvolus]